MTNPRVASLLEDIRRLSQECFALGLDPDVSEEVKYGGLLFSAGKPFCGVFAYAKLRRYIKLSTIDEVDQKHVLHYMTLALRAHSGKGGCI